VISILREYHAEMGKLVQKHEGTLERFTGDAMMVVFNDPIEVEDPERRALDLVLAMRDGVVRLREGWERDGFELNFGAGIAAGYATIGGIGFEGRMEYAAIGQPVHLSSRLSDVAGPGQILVSQRVMGPVEAEIDSDPLGNLELKGLPRSTRVYQVHGRKRQGAAADETKRLIGPGATLDRGHYRLESVLGAGGMATAYLARDRRLDRRIVIKIPHAKLMSEQGFRERFHSELRNLTRLNHPNIVKVYDAGEEGGLPYAVVQYLAGGELKGRMQGRQSLEQVLGWVRGVAEALDYIHGEGILHRDIKPENILFDEAGRAYVSDFGLAKALTDGQSVEQTEAGYLVGSFRYIAPEYVNRDFSAACDQYSLAVVVYEALSESYPHDAERVEQIVRQKLDSPPTPLCDRISLPDSAMNAVMRALEPNPADRFESCVAFAQALGDA
jgi:tRNA A-37 threonylcarbamoyl transferase component Bud32